MYKWSAFVRIMSTLEVVRVVLLELIDYNFSVQQITRMQYIYVEKEYAAIVRGLDERIF
jgi:hypothetical protein